MEKQFIPCSKGKKLSQRARPCNENHSFPRLGSGCRGWKWSQISFHTWELNKAQILRETSTLHCRLQCSLCLQSSWDGCLHLPWQFPRGNTCYLAKVTLVYQLSCNAFKLASYSITQMHFLSKHRNSTCNLAGKQEMGYLVKEIRSALLLILISAVIFWSSWIYEANGEWKDNLFLPNCVPFLWHKKAKVLKKGMQREGNSDFIFFRSCLALRGGFFSLQKRKMLPLAFWSPQKSRHWKRYETSSSGLLDSLLNASV